MDGREIEYPDYLINIQEAIHDNNLRRFKYFANRDEIDIHYQDYALYLSTALGHDKIVKHIIENGSLTKAKYRAIKLGAEHGHLEVVKVLLEDCIACNENYRCDIQRDKVDKQLEATKQYALTLSEIKKHTKIADYLLNHVFDRQENTNEWIMFQDRD
jgi:uncharacterized CHY-type Zn-finger protein